MLVAFRQGSILGRLLFLIYMYVNEMAGAIDDKILLYADDTAILISDTETQHFYSTCKWLK